MARAQHRLAAARNGTVARIQQPPAILLEALADARGRGLDFEQAWPESVAAALSGLRGVERGDWGAALSGTRSAWEIGWNRWPGTRRVRAPLAVTAESSREPIGLRCPTCGAHVEQPAHGRRKVYSRACQRAAHGRKLDAA
jgi:hypothetical protein